MKKVILIFVAFFTLPYASLAQYPNNVNIIDAKPNATTNFSGNLSKGEKVADLTWAENSAVACFPSTQNPKFTGNHVFHAFQIPAYSEVTVTLIPADKNANFSLYGYQVSQTNYVVVPNVSSCTSCEADYKWDYPKKGQTQDHTRNIFFNSTTNAYNIFIGVTGADGLTSGDYSLTIEIETKIVEVENSLILEPAMISMIPDFTTSTTVTGDLKDGKKLKDLSWAANSSVACFPSTQNSKFNGNHVFFQTEIPANTTMKIKLIPEDVNANMSIYAYTNAVGVYEIFPNLSSCVACEAEHKWDNPKKGKTQDHTRTVSLNATTNPYRVVIGVVGAEGLMEGKFRLLISLK